MKYLKYIIIFLVGMILYLILNYIDTFVIGGLFKIDDDLKDKLRAQDIYVPDFWVDIDNLFEWFKNLKDYKNIDIGSCNIIEFNASGEESRLIKDCMKEEDNVSVYYTLNKEGFDKLIGSNVSIDKSLSGSAATDDYFARLEHNKLQIIDVLIKNGYIDSSENIENLERLLIFDTPDELIEFLKKLNEVFTININELQKHIEAQSLTRLLYLKKQETIKCKLPTMKKIIIIAIRDSFDEPNVYKISIVDITDMDEVEVFNTFSNIFATMCITETEFEQAIKELDKFSYKLPKVLEKKLTKDKARECKILDKDKKQSKLPFSSDVTSTNLQVIKFWINLNGNVATIKDTLTTNPGETIVIYLTIRQYKVLKNWFSSNRFENFDKLLTELFDNFYFMKYAEIIGISKNDNTKTKIDLYGSLNNKKYLINASLSTSIDLTTVNTNQCGGGACTITSLGGPPLSELDKVAPSTFGRVTKIIHLGSYWVTPDELKRINDWLIENNKKKTGEDIFMLFPFLLTELLSTHQHQQKSKLRKLCDKYVSGPKYWRFKLHGANTHNMQNLQRYFPTGKKVGEVFGPYTNISDLLDEFNSSREVGLKGVLFTRDMFEQMTGNQANAMRIGERCRQVRYPKTFYLIDANILKMFSTICNCLSSMVCGYVFKKCAIYYINVVGLIVPTSQRWHQSPIPPPNKWETLGRGRGQWNGLERKTGNTFISGSLTGSEITGFKDFLEKLKQYEEQCKYINGDVNGEKWKWADSSFSLTEDFHMPAVGLNPRFKPPERTPAGRGKWKIEPPTYDDYRLGTAQFLSSTEIMERIIKEYEKKAKRLLELLMQQFVSQENALSAIQRAFILLFSKDQAFDLSSICKLELLRKNQMGQIHIEWYRDIFELDRTQWDARLGKANAQTRTGTWFPYRNYGFGNEARYEMSSYGQSNYAKTGTPMVDQNRFNRYKPDPIPAQSDHFDTPTILREDRWGSTEKILKDMLEDDDYGDSITKAKLLDALYSAGGEFVLLDPSKQNENTPDYLLKLINALYTNFWYTFKLDSGNNPITDISDFQTLGPSRNAISHDQDGAEIVVKYPTKLVLPREWMVIDQKITGFVDGAPPQDRARTNKLSHLKSNLSENDFFHKHVLARDFNLRSNKFNNYDVIGLTPEVLFGNGNWFTLNDQGFLGGWTEELGHPPVTHEMTTNYNPFTDEDDILTVSDSPELDSLREILFGDHWFGYLDNSLSDDEFDERFPLTMTPTEWKTTWEKYYDDRYRGPGQLHSIKRHKWKNFLHSDDPDFSAGSLAGWAMPPQSALKDSNGNDQTGWGPNGENFEFITKNTAKSRLFEKFRFKKPTPYPSSNKNKWNDFVREVILKELKNHFDSCIGESPSNAYKTQCAKCGFNSLLKLLKKNGININEIFKYHLEETETKYEIIQNYYNNPTEDTRNKLVEMIFNIIRGNNRLGSIINVRGILEILMISDTFKNWFYNIFLASKCNTGTPGGAALPYDPSGENIDINNMNIVQYVMFLTRLTHDTGEDIIDILRNNLTTTELRYYFINGDINIFGLIEYLDEENIYTEMLENYSINIALQAILEACTHEIEIGEEWTGGVSYYIGRSDPDPNNMPKPKTILLEVEDYLLNPDNLDDLFTRVMKKEMRWEDQPDDWDQTTSVDPMQFQRQQRIFETNMNKFQSRLDLMRSINQYTTPPTLFGGYNISGARTTLTHFNESYGSTLALHEEWVDESDLWKPSATRSPATRSLRKLNSACKRRDEPPRECVNPNAIRELYLRQSVENERHRLSRKVVSSDESNTLYMDGKSYSLGPRWQPEPEPEPKSHVGTQLPGLPPQRKELPSAPLIAEAVATAPTFNLPEGTPGDMPIVLGQAVSRLTKSLATCDFVTELEPEPEPELQPEPELINIEIPQHLLKTVKRALNVLFNSSRWYGNIWDDHSNLLDALMDKPPLMDIRDDVGSKESKPPDRDWLKRWHKVRWGRTNSYRQQLYWDRRRRFDQCGSIIEPDLLENLYKEPRRDTSQIQKEFKSILKKYFKYNSYAGMHGLSFIYHNLTTIVFQIFFKQACKKHNVDNFRLQKGKGKGSSRLVIDVNDISNIVIHDNILFIRITINGKHQLIAIETLMKILRRDKRLTSNHPKNFAESIQETINDIFTLIARLFSTTEYLKSFFKNLDNEKFTRRHLQQYFEQFISPIIRFTTALLDQLYSSYHNAYFILMDKYDKKDTTRLGEDDYGRYYLENLQVYYEKDFLKQIFQFASANRDQYNWYSFLIFNFFQSPEIIKYFEGILILDFDRKQISLLKFLKKNLIKSLMPKEQGQKGNIQPALTISGLTNRIETTIKQLDKQILKQISDLTKGDIGKRLGLPKIDPDKLTAETAAKIILYILTTWFYKKKLILNKISDLLTKILGSAWPLWLQKTIEDLLCGKGL